MRTYCSPSSLFAFCSMGRNVEGGCAKAIFASTRRVSFLPSEGRIEMFVYNFLDSLLESPS